MVTVTPFFPPATLRTLTAIVSAALFTTQLLHAQAPQQAARTWTNKEGRSIIASLVEVAGGNVILQLENGARSPVPMATLSKADQDYLQTLASNKPAAGGAAAVPSSSGALTWPQGVISVDPKTIVVTEGLQDAAARRHHYLAGNFEFISTAPLAGSVMAEVAADFLLTEKFLSMQPWTWKPHPKKGERFIVYMAESNSDYLALGGKEDNASDIVDDNSLIRFNALGLKKVGSRYQYDSREKEPGRVTSIVAYAMLYDVAGWLYNWSSMGFSNFLRFVAYQNNGTVRCTGLDSALKKAIKDRTESGKITLDMTRMLKFMHPAKEPRGSDNQARFEQQLDGFLLIYYFGFLDGDGSGAALHQYYRNVFARSKRVDSPEAAAMLKAEGLEKATPEEILAKLLRGRDDAQLAAEMTEKFKSIGVKFGG